MAKLLVVRKPDRTIHTMPLANKAAAMAYSNRLPPGDRWKFEEMDEKEAADLPYFDENYVTADNASQKLKAKDQEIADKDKQLAELQAQLEALKAGKKEDPIKEESKKGKGKKEEDAKEDK